MIFRNITHTLDTLSPTQQVNLLTVSQLLNNLNSLKPLHVVNSEITYDGNEFMFSKFGYLHAFLLNDIKEILKNDLDGHLLFIKELIENYFKEYLHYTDKSKDDLNRLKELFKSTFDYYSLNLMLDYPIYFKQDEFKEAINKFKISTDLKLSKL